MSSVFHAAILKASEDQGTRWPVVAEQLLPGAHVILVGDTPTWQRSSLGARKAGLEVRDAIAVVGPSGLDFAVLLRKPLAEPSLTAQLLKTGTGALNIDATRIFTDWNEPDRPDSWKRSGHSAKPEAEKIAAPPGTGINCHPKGRWPANLVFIHGEECVRDKENWACVPGCPVPAIDKQSLAGGMHSAGKNRKGFGHRTGNNDSMFAGDHEGNGMRFGDSGGASRFYKQFKSHGELYTYFITLIQPETGALLMEFPP